jgi:hypothetical protein
VEGFFIWSFIVPCVCRVCVCARRVGPSAAMSNKAGTALLLGESLQADSGDDDSVPDRFWLAYIVCYLLGIGSLLPWNAMITPTEYLHLRTAGSPFEQSFLSMLTTSFTCTALRPASPPPPFATPRRAASATAAAC